MRTLAAPPGCRAAARRGRAAVAAALLVGLADLAPGAQHGPPAGTGASRRPELVELAPLEPTLRLEIRYATPNNFVGAPVYAEARAFLQRPAAEALVRAHRALRPKGYGLLVFDGYRPWSVTKRFWDLVGDERFVAHPAKGSRHNRGCAVDLTLYDLATGREVEMPSGYDEFSPRAAADFETGDPILRARRELLRAVMEAEGFTVNQDEWWHFDHADWREYPVLDLPFEQLPRR